MLTNDNLKQVLLEIDPEELQTVLDGDKDYVYLQLHIFNVGSHPTIEEHDYDENLEQQAQGNGMLFCSKDEFLDLMEIIHY